MDSGGQTCLAFTLATEPRSEIFAYSDRFGNDVRHFDVLHPHQRLSIVAISEVLTPYELRDYTPELSMLDAYDFLSPTRYAPHDDLMQEFARPRVVAGDSFTSAMNLMRAIYFSIRYEPGATHVHTSADEVLELKAGVCQDFAHLMLAACRCSQIPARYVSGYLHSHTDRSDDVATHAWVDVFIAGKGWISLDPTHNTLQTEHYVRVAVGRDYADVPPTRGTYKGNAKESLEVKVKIQPL